MQLRGTIYCPLIALHVSNDNIAHHQELLSCILKASGDTHVTVCRCRGRIRTQSSILPRQRQAVTSPGVVGDSAGVVGESEF
jgi:hypothetical protein